MSDPFYNSVSLLLHCDGANASTTFTDTSPTPKTVTTNGNAQISTTQSKFGGASALFDGVGDSLSLTGTSFNTEDFTVEGFIRTSSTGQTFVLFDSRNSDFTDNGFVFYVRTTNKLTFGRGNPFVVTEGTTDVPINVWNHITLTRESGVVRCFLNGVQEFSVTDTKSFSLTTWRIGHQFDTSGTHGTFYIDELRITKGVARYTQSFAPPVAPFGDSLPPTFPGDSYFNQVSLLLHCDGTNGSTSFVDTSPITKTVTTNGNAQISTAQSKFGGASAYFDGSGDYLTIPTSTDFDLGNTYTIEFWILPNTLASNFGILHRGFYTTTTNSWNGLAFSIRYLGTVCRFYFYATTLANEQYIDVSLPFSTTRWTHVAMVRNGTTGSVYIDGVLSGTISGLNTPATSTQSLRLGLWDFSAGNEHFNGYLDDVRITKGIARYTSNFAVPTKAYYDNLPSLPGDIYFNNVSLLLNMNGPEGGTTFTDSSSTPKTVTPNGNVKTSTIQSKFGGASAYFDGTGDYLSIPSNTAFGFGTGDFTCEMWLYLNSNTGTINLLDFRTTATAIPWVWNITGSKLGMYTPSGTLAVGTAILNTATWYHLAITRKDGVIRHFVNGVLDGQATNTSDFSSSCPLRISGAPDNTANINGYIDDLRITKGIARYTENFTPPSSEFSRYTGRVLGYVLGPNGEGLNTTIRAYNRSTGALVGSTTSNQSVNAVGETADPNVSILLHFDGPNNSTAFTDSSLSPKTITRFGDAKISTLQSKFGGSSLYLDGVGDTINLSNDSSLSFGSGPFCIEFWVHPTSTTASKLYSHGENGGSYWPINEIYYNTNGTISWSINYTNANVFQTLTSSSSIAVNNWTHLAFTRTSNTFRIFINGVQAASLTWAITILNSPTPAYIGSYLSSSSPISFFQGYIDEFRITKGNPVYSENFTPQSSSFFPKTPVDSNYSDVALLLPMNSANGSTTFVDRSLSRKTVTPSGNAQISTSFSKYSGSSAFFDGSGDYLSVGSADDWTFLHDGTAWTVEGWYKFNSFSNSPVLFGTTSTTAQHGMLVYVNTSRQIMVQIYRGVSSSFVIEGTISQAIPNDGLFHHIAVCFDYTLASDNLKVYIDGVLAGSLSKTANPTSTSNPSNTLSIGVTLNTTASNNYSGYIDDFRITKGVVRYTSNFTPPGEFYPANSTLSLTTGGYLLPVSTLNEVSVICSDSESNVYANDLVKRAIPQ